MFDTEALDYYYSDHASLLIMHNVLRQHSVYVYALVRTWQRTRPSSRTILEFRNAIDFLKSEKLLACRQAPKLEEDSCLLFPNANLHTWRPS